MARALADMTPEERRACVGMWCEFELGALSILQQVGIYRAYCIIPNGFNVEQSMHLERLTPRFDLPRAWNPDGTPAATTEEVEYRIVDPDTNGGRYEMRRWVRGVTEWRLDDE